MISVRIDQGTVQSLSNTMFGVHKNVPCYKGKFYKGIYRKMTISWSFSYNINLIFNIFFAGKFFAQDSAFVQTLQI